MDKIIGKKVYRIVGNVLAANYMRVPFKANQSLQLTGRYVHIQLRAIPDRFYILHFYVTTSDERVLDISITNLFKECKVIGNVLQYPCHLSGKWTTLGVDLVDMLRRNNCGQFHCLKSIQRRIHLRRVILQENDPKALCIPIVAVPDKTEKAERCLESIGAVVKEPAGREPLRVQTISQVNRGACSTKNMSHTKASRPTTVMPKLNSSVASDQDSKQKLATTFSPEPAMELRFCIGYTSKTTGNMIWTKDCRSIIYSCAAKIVHMNPDTGSQKFFLGHTMPISVIALSPDESILASCQEGKDPLVRLWEMSTGECLAVFGGHASDVQCIDFNLSGTWMITVGKEGKGSTKNFNNLVILWDISQVLKGGNVTKLVEHSFEPSLNKMRFVPFEEACLVSCGIGNIHIWRMKSVREKYEVRRMVLHLGPHSNQVFVDLAFEGVLGGVDTFARSIYSCTSSGLLYQINFTNRNIDQIYRLHDDSINSVVVTDGFCVTGSEDRFLRVWPLDFSDYFLEAEHAAPVNALAVSSDCLRIAIGTANGTIGIMDVPTHGYRTVVRSHESVVLALAMDPHNREFTTTASDGTIRTWDLDSFEQLYEFLAPGEHALCVAYHPLKYLIACGFEDGAVRIFDIASTSQLFEHKQHRSKVLSISFTMDGEKLFTAGQDGIICVYDAVRNYQPIKSISTAFAGDEIDLSISPNGKYIATIGVGCASVIIYNTDSMDKCMEMSSNGRRVKLVKFAPIKNYVYAMTRDSRLQSYDLNEGRIVQESSPLHLDNVNTMDFSDNGNFLLTGGNDGILKMWALGKNGPHEARCQCFIGHSSPINRALFTPDKKQVVSVGSGKGILVWDLLVDTAEDVSDYIDRVIAEKLTAESQQLDGASDRPETPPPKWPERQSGDTEALLEELLRFKQQLVGHSEEASTAAADYPSNVEAISEPSPLQRLRERAMNMEFSSSASISSQNLENSYSFIDSDVRAEQSQMFLPLIHFSGTTKPVKRAERKYVAAENEAGIRMLHVSGYMQMHNCMLWQPEAGLFTTAIGSNIIIEDLHTRKQTMLHEHEEQISCIALSPGGKWLAVGSGVPLGSNATAPIFIWQYDSATTVRRLDYHQESIQSLAWSRDSSFLISVGNCEHPRIVVWNVRDSKIVATSDCDRVIHDVKFCKSSFEFVSVGQEFVTFWLLNDDSTLLMQELTAPGDDPANVHYTCLDVTEDNIVFVGAANGFVTQWIANSEQNVCIDSWDTSQRELTSIFAKQDKVYTCGQFPHVRLWGKPIESLTNTAVAWQMIRDINFDSPSKSLSLDDRGNEGVASTASGTIWHFGKDPATKISSGHSEDILDVAYSDDGELLASCAADGRVMVWTVKGMQHLKTFDGSRHSCLCIAFGILPVPTPRALTFLRTAPTGASIIAGYADGVARELVLTGSTSSVSNAVLIDQEAITVRDKPVDPRI
eukprot:768485-Hanusia_phi.AAC.1